MSKVILLEKRQFWGHWRWVHRLTCGSCGKVTKLLGNDTRRGPSLPPGAIICECGAAIRMNRYG